MASAIIHLAVAKQLEQKLDIKNKKDYYLGSIAPDISKQIGKSKQKSHFLINTKPDIPNIKSFTNKYPNYKQNSFDLGYFIHLYTDKLWFSEFMSKIISGNYIKLLDGTIIKTTPKEIQNLIYQDYTNLNIKLLDEYEMDLSLFYEEFSVPKTSLDEIPIEKLNVLIDKMGIIIKNSKEQKAYTFDISIIINFIDDACSKILNYLNEN